MHNDKNNQCGKLGIPLFAINLKKRTDRRNHIKTQFDQRDEFNFTLVEAKEHSISATGLWITIQHIIRNLTDDGSEFIIICEDDHKFTDFYSKEVLQLSLEEARDKGADVLLGGVSWTTNSFRVSPTLFWIECFTGLQFTIIFRKFFDKILNSDFLATDTADGKISSLTQDKYLIYPFISIQKEFGYSDITPDNNIQGRVDNLFVKAAEKLKDIDAIISFYNYKKITAEVFNNVDFENIEFPTYIINLPERTDRANHIRKQFAGKKEFDVKFVAAIKHKIGSLGLWLTIRKIISSAITNDDELIIICEDDHEFTPNYSRDSFIKNVIISYSQGVEFLSGGIGGFGSAVPVAEGRFWIASFLGTQFIVLFRSVFQKILDEEFNDYVAADAVFSELTANKMVIYPFISVQRDFGYSDATDNHNNSKGMIEQRFSNSSNSLRYLQNAYNRLML